MDKKVKLALLAMLGFSTACSSAKKSAQSPEQPEIDPAPEVIEQPRIMVMYGVRPPYPVAIKDGEEIRSINEEEKTQNGAENAGAENADGAATDNGEVKSE